MQVLTSAEAAKLLGVKHWWLIWLVKTEKTKAPRKNSAGQYVWLEADVSRAKEDVEKILAARQLKCLAK